VAQLLVLLLVSVVEGRLPSEGIFVGDCQFLFRRPEILHGEHVDQARVSESLLEEHND
jgi:hypothetical protein